MSVRKTISEDVDPTLVVLSKTLTSSDITTTAVDLTSAATGRFYVQDIVARTGDTGLAGGTNFTVQSNNASGLAAILTETVANLGASKTVNLDTASVTKQRTILENGKKLQVLCTGTNCTGTGTVTIDVFLRRLDSAATIAVV